MEPVEDKPTADTALHEGTPISSTNSGSPFTNELVRK